MARNFVRANSDYLENAAAAVTAYPVTMACWVQCASVGIVQVPLGLFNSTDNTTNRLYINITAGNVAQAVANATTASAPGTVSAGTWAHIAAVFTSATSRVAYLDGSAGSATATNQAVTGLDRTTIGRRGGGTPGAAFNGRVAEAAIWSVAMGAIDVAALARGVTPRRIRPESLVGYWPIWGLHSPEIGLAGGLYPMTVTGATAAEHAPVMPPSRRRWGTMPLIEEAGGGSSIPVIMHHRRQQGMS